MIPIRKTVFIFLPILVLLSCVENKNDKFINRADFNNRILKVDYAQSPDTSIQQIILLSGIRKSGYGILLNVEEAKSQTAVQEIKTRMRKQDINAVHEFLYRQDDPVSNKLKAALEGATFIWWFSNEKDPFKSDPYQKVKPSIQKALSNKGILVIEK